MKYIKQIIVHDMQRGSGKTRHITHRLLGDSKLLVLVANQVQKRHMMEAVNNHNLSNLNTYLDSHIITFDKFIDGTFQDYRDIDKVLIDEGLNLDYELMFNLMYYLGRLNIKAEVYGSTHVYTDKFNVLVRQLHGSESQKKHTL